MKKPLGPRLRVLHCCADQNISNVLAKMELTAAQGRIIGFLCHQSVPQRVQDVAEEFHLSTPTASGLLSRLEKKEFIQFLPDEADRRCKRIHVLPKGHDCHNQIMETIHATEQQLVQDFSPEEQQQFIALLDRAIANMGITPCRKNKKEE